MFQAINSHHCEDLSIKPMSSDSALYVSKIYKLLQNFSETYVYDILRAQKKNYKEKKKYIADFFEWIKAKYHLTFN